MHKISILLTFLVFLTSSIIAQTSLDIVRASNYYSKAVSSYDRGSYTAALSELKLAEDNLKGKTNRDLEYLKIMSNYRKGNYEKAYKLVQVFFEVGYDGRTEYFRNITTYREKHAISYNEKLTSIFIELEEKFGIVKNTSVDDVVASIVNRIKSEKKSMSTFLRENTDSYERITVAQIRRVDYFPYNDRYKYGSWMNVDLRLDREIYSNYVVYEGSDMGQYNYNFKVKVKFAEDKSVSSSAYSYTFRKSGSNYVSGSVTRLAESNMTQRWQIVTGYGNKDISLSSLNQMAKKKVQNRRFCDEKSKTYTISFTETEILVLKQEGNYEKLRQALRNQGLL